MNLAGVDFAALSPAARATLADVVQPMVEDDLDERGVAELLHVDRREISDRLRSLGGELAALADTRTLGGRWPCVRRPPGGKH